MIILGLNAYHADASAVIVVEGRLVAAAEEERFNRVKHSAGFPYRAVNFCLSQAGVRIEDVDHIAVAQSPDSNWLNNTTAIQSDQFLVGIDRANRFLFPARIKNIPDEIRLAVGEKCFIRARFHTVPHHLAHLACGFLTSKFRDAALASIDSFGDFSSTMIALGHDSELDVLKVVPFPHSLGIFCTMVTQYLGFSTFGDEGKVMGLAAYGTPRFLNKLQKLIRYDEDKGFELSLDYFTHHRNGFRITWQSAKPSMSVLFSPRMVEDFGPARLPGEDIVEFHCDMAASLQRCLEEEAVCLLRDLYSHSDSRNLVLAGGVALNSVLNAKIPERVPFQDIYIPPAAGDSGTALGAALYIHNVVLKKPRSFELAHAFWGPEFTDQACRKALDFCGLKYRQVDSVALTAAQLIAAGSIVGWFQGRMEFGPRALGNRSILADPRTDLAKSKINCEIKLREPFRPFAASILADRVGEFFQHSVNSPYMSEVFTIRPDKKGLLPAISHVDDTTRLQTVTRESNPLFWDLIDEFDRLCNVPMVLNTSFNQQEPIVCTPEDAIRTYLNSSLDALFLGDLLVEKQTRF